MWTPRNTLILGMLIAESILGFAESQIIALLKPMLQESLHWSDSDYGRLTSISQFSSAIALLGSGWIVDRIGWRLANPMSMGMRSVAAVAHAFTNTLGQFTIARVVLGTAESFATPTVIKTIAAVFKNEDRALAIGIMNMISAPGLMLTSMAIPWLALQIGWQYSFVFTGGLGLAWVVVWLILSPGKEPDHVPIENSTAAETLRWRMVVADRRTWTIAGAKVLSDPVYWLFLFWMPDLFHRVFHLSLAEYGLPLAVIHACAAFGSLMGGWIPRQMMKRGASLNTARKISLFAAALMVTPVWLVLLVEDYWIATAILGLTLAGHQAFSVNIFALATDITPAPRVATVISLSAFSGRLAGTVVLQGAGWILGAGYGYGPLLGLASIFYLLGFGWVQLLQPNIGGSTGQTGQVEQ
jgi:ACS family hexuronate transporter-like MFS transporter